jgi:hypothetical protein
MMQREKRRREDDPVWTCSRCGTRGFDDRDQPTLIDDDELLVCERCLTFVERRSLAEAETEFHKGLERERAER